MIIINRLTTAVYTQ